MNNKIKFFFKIFIVPILLGVFFLFLQKKNTSFQEGSLAFDFSLKKQDGVSLTLSHLKGKVVLLNFWATTCAPCVSEMASLEKLSKTFGSNVFEILAVSMDEGGWKDIESFKKSHPISFNVLLDEEFKVADLYGIYRIPETYLIDKNGLIVEKILGPQDWVQDNIIRKINALISK